MLIGKGLSEGYFTSEELREITSRESTRSPSKASSCWYLIPDSTRTMPMPIVFDLFEEVVQPTG